VGEPTAEPLVSEEVREELPEDLALLNAAGYLEDVFFDTNLYDIKPEFRDALARNAAWLQQHRTIQILIEGHCDERNTREYNLALGERRAAAVRDYLIFLGAAPERLRTISYGEERPFAPSGGEVVAAQPPRPLRDHRGRRRLMRSLRPSASCAGRSRWWPAPRPRT
jgi:peptidoglycan-associated lipoprotein